MTKCETCGGNHWHAILKGDLVFASPCPDCKPEEHAAYSSGELTDRYFTARNDSNESNRKKNIQRAKERFDF